MDEAETTLATYGTLAPGRVNAHLLAGLDGVWSTGTVRGRLVEAGWGAEHGCPGIVLDPEGDEVEVHLFRSTGLPSFWPKLDAFEGEGYRRVPVDVTTEGGAARASIYTVVV